MLHCRFLLPILLIAFLPRPAAADVDFLAPGRTFGALVADPRWPRFAASWQEYAGDPFLSSAGAVALGDTFAVLRQSPQPGDLPTWEIGLQTAVFATFEPLGPSQDLFNADWQFGLYAAGRAGRWSGMFRLLHQSSHLGDEFLLFNPEVIRVDFVFQHLGGLIAFEPTDWSRLYGGGGWLFDVYPGQLRHWMFQYGLELRWPETIWQNWARPVAAVDVQHWQGRQWQGDVSLVAGLEVKDPRRDGPTLRVLLELYSGRNPNGQFFEENLRYAGIGLQMNL